YDAPGLDWSAGMGAENIEEFGAAASGEAALSEFLAAQAPGLATVPADALAAALGDLVSDVDKRALTGDFAEFLARSFHKAVSTGIAGWRDDDAAFVRDWGFPLGGVGAPAAGAATAGRAASIAIWQGGEDRMVPYAHGEWLAANVAGAQPHLRPEHGHLSLVVGS